MLYIARKSYGMPSYIVVRPRRATLILECPNCARNGRKNNTNLSHHTMLYCDVHLILEALKARKNRPCRNVGPESFT